MSSIVFRSLAAGIACDLRLFTPPVLMKRLNRDLRLSVLVFGDGGVAEGAVDIRRRLSGRVAEEAEVGVGASMRMFC